MPRNRLPPRCRLLFPGACRGIVMLHRFKGVSEAAVHLYHRRRILRQRSSALHHAFFGQVQRDLGLRLGGVRMRRCAWARPLQRSAYLCSNKLCLLPIVGRGQLLHNAHRLRPPDICCMCQARATLYCRNEASGRDAHGSCCPNARRRHPPAAEAGSGDDKDWLLPGTRERVGS